MRRLPKVVPGEARDTVQAKFPDGRIFEGPVGTPLEAFVKAAYGEDPDMPVAAIANGRLRELSENIRTDVEVVPIRMSSTDGARIYRRSLTFLLVVAAAELFPEAQIYVDHSLTFGGYFCRVEGHEPLTEEEIKRLESRMAEIVEEDAPITRKEVPLSVALALFRQRGDDDKLRLLKYRKKDYLTLYELHGFEDYFHGYMVPSTGYLKQFALEKYSGGFILRFPLRRQPTKLQPTKDYPNLVAVFRRYGEWLRLIGVRDVGSLNEAVATGRIKEIVLVSEALHEQHIAEIASSILKRGARLVLIAGPSSSGKTTFARRLAVQLKANGVLPFPLSTDDYFLDRDKTPLGEDGKPDFESINALDLDLLNHQLLDLMDGKEVQLPYYNFKTGKREEGDRVRLSPDHIIIVEGIHGLNPALVPLVGNERIFRIYVSALTQLNLDRHNRVSTTDTRLLRRIVRDATYRGYSAQDTLSNWEKVRAGERKYIFPYQENADVMFNSALVYELSAIKPLVEPLLRQVNPDSTEYVEAKRLLAFLDWFLPCECSAMTIPGDSLLREFIGGSILREVFAPHKG
jgi:uridine kinase